VTTRTDDRASRTLCRLPLVGQPFPNLRAGRRGVYVQGANISTTQRGVNGGEHVHVPFKLRRPTHVS
jgi:hypothetical protein